MKSSKSQDPSCREIPSSKLQIPSSRGHEPLAKSESLRQRARRWRSLLGLGVVGCLALLANITSGQSYSIDWYKISGGGGTSTGGAYQVSGTVGQHDAGEPMTGGTFSLTGGFWALISTAQTPGAPTLYISGSGNSVTVYWPAVAGWSLQQNNSVAASANWSASSGVTTSNGTNYLNITPPAGNLFFRLIKQ